MENRIDYKPIFEIYGSNGFIKVKPDMLDKGKVIFSFVTVDESKKADKDKSFDVFLDVTEALAFGKCCENGFLYRWTCNKVKEAQSKGSQYPEASWTSSLGVSKGEERKFYISKAQKGDYLFTAQKRFGTISKSADGKVNFHPYEKNKDKEYKDSIYVRIPTSEFTLVELSCALSEAVRSFNCTGVALAEKKNNNASEQSVEDLPLPTNMTATENDSEEYSYPLEDEIREVLREQPEQTVEEKSATPVPDSSKVKAYKVKFTSNGKFEFADGVGYLRVAINGKEGKRMRFEKNLTQGTTFEKMFFSKVQKGQGTVEFTCLAKDLPNYILYCGDLT